MKKKINKTTGSKTNTLITVALFVMIIVVAIVGIVAGGKSKNERYDDYSYGLDRNGLYIDLDNHICELPDFTTWDFTCDELLEWGANSAKEAGDENIHSVDDYVKKYANEQLAALGLADKEIVEEGDIVAATLNFYIDDKKLDDYTSTNNYKAAVEGDSIITSFIGHKTGDKYDVEYTFPEDDKEYPAKTAKVEILVESVVMDNPIDNEVVENNIDTIAKYFKDVVDADSFMEFLRPEIAKSIIMAFIEEKLQTLEGVEVPEEFVEYELYRLKSRLSQIGYTYKHYLDSMEMTDEEAREYCAMVAKENYITMLVMKKMDLSVTEEALTENYGESLEYMVEMQGKPYLKLDVMRDWVVTAVSNCVSIDGERVYQEETPENEVVGDADVSESVPETDPEKVENEG